VFRNRQLLAAAKRLAGAGKAWKKAGITGW